MTVEHFDTSSCHYWHVLQFMRTVETINWALVFNIYITEQSQTTKSGPDRTMNMNYEELYTELCLPLKLYLCF